MVVSEAEKEAVNECIAILLTNLESCSDEYEKDTTLILQAMISLQKKLNHHNKTVKSYLIYQLDAW